jgi:hypothetical protein
MDFGVVRQLFARNPPEEVTCVSNITFILIDIGESEEKNGGANHLNPGKRCRGGRVKRVFQIRAIGALLLMGAGLVVSGCKSTAELSQADAQKLVQADYDSRPAAGAGIYVNEIGLKQGLNAKYWKLIKVYPNNRWADYALTDDGKKVLKLDSGGEMIEWRPDSGNNFHFYVTTLQTNHFKAKDVESPHDDVVPGVTTAKSAGFNETLNLEGVPQPLVDLAHNAGNKLSSKKTANFSYEGSQWKLHSIE